MIYEDEAAQARADKLAAVRGKNSGVERIYRERVRQVDVEGYELEGDIGRTYQLLAAAGVYLQDVQFMITHPDYEYNRDGNPWMQDIHFGPVNRGWPWGDHHYKPGNDPDRLLERVGALIASVMDAREAEKK